MAPHDSLHHIDTAPRPGGCSLSVVGSIGVIAQGVRKIPEPNDFIRFPHRYRSYRAYRSYCEGVRKNDKNEIIIKKTIAPLCDNSQSYGTCIHACRRVRSSTYLFLAITGGVVPVHTCSLHASPCPSYTTIRFFLPGCSPLSSCLMMTHHEQHVTLTLSITYL